MIKHILHIIILLLTFNNIYCQNKQYRTSIYYIDDSLINFNTTLSKGTLVFLNSDSCVYILNEIATTNDNLSSISKINLCKNKIYFKKYTVNINSYSFYEINYYNDNFVNIMFFHNSNEILLPYQFDNINNKIKIFNNSNQNLSIEILLWYSK